MVSVWGEEVQVVLFPYSSGQYTSWVGNVASDCKYVPFELCRIIVSLIFTSWHSVYAEQAYNLLHHLSPRSDWLLISLHSITFKLNMKVMRTNEIITESNQSQMKSCYQFSDICPVCVDCVCVILIFSSIDLANASFTFEVEDSDRLTQFQIWWENF